MEKQKIYNIYDKEVTYENINYVWNIVRRTCKNKKAILRFAMNKNTNISNILNMLKSKTYYPMKFKIFVIFEPKARLVMSSSVIDKIVNHFIANFYLIPCLEKKLINQNVATRKKMGSRYANEIIVKYINTIRIKEKNKDIYALKVDISKYFYNIDHNILLEKLKKEIADPDVICLIERVLSETNKNYVNETVKYYNENYNINIPYYQKDVGLSIGAMTSQFLAIFYLNDLDHYIKEILKCKYYIRYMDDFIIFDTRKDRLKEIWKIIEQKITELKLTMNPKSNIVKLNNGLSFVGYKYIIENGKFKIKFKKKTIKKIVKRLKILKEKDKEKYYKTYASYYGYLKKIKKSERVFKMNNIEKYDYYKKKNPNFIIFVKDKKFFKTYNDDAIIMWHIFHYKWFNNCISFGIVPSSKVFDTLRNSGLGYIVISDEEIIVQGDDRIYKLYKELSSINYRKYCHKQEIIKLVEKIFEQNDDNYENVSKFLNDIINENIKNKQAE